MIHSYRASFAALLTAFCATNAQAVSITVDQLSLSDSQKAALSKALGEHTVATAYPGIAFGSPVGFGLSYGQASLGIGGSTLPDTASDDYDGAMGVAVGLGDPSTNVGVELAVNIISLRNSFGEDGSFSAKAHRMVGARSAVAVGTEAQAGWGNARDADASYYGVATTVVNGPLGKPLVVNLGVGNQRFRDYGLPASRKTPGVFGGLAYVAHKQASFILDYTGLDLNAAVSLVPMPKWPVVITLGFSNLGQQENVDREFSGAIGYLFKF